MDRDKLHVHRFWESKSEAPLLVKNVPLIKGQPTEGSFFRGKGDVAGSYRGRCDS